MKKISFYGIPATDIFPHADICDNDYRAAYLPTVINYGDCWNVKTLAFYTDEFFESEEAREQISEEILWLKSLVKIASLKECPLVVMTEEIYYTYDSPDDPLVIHLVPNVNFNIDTTLSKKKAIVVLIQDVYGDLQPSLDNSPYIRITSENEYLDAKKAKMSKRKAAFDDQQYTYDPYVYAVSLGLIPSATAFDSTKSMVIQGSFFLGNTSKHTFSAITTQSSYNTLMATTYRSTFGEEWDDQEQKT